MGSWEVMAASGRSTRSVAFDRGPGTIHGTGVQVNWLWITAPRRLECFFLQGQLTRVKRAPSKASVLARAPFVLEPKQRSASQLTWFLASDLNGSVEI